MGSQNCPTGDGDLRDLELSSRLELWIGGACLVATKCRGGERALWHGIRDGFLGGLGAMMDYVGWDNTPAGYGGGAFATCIRHLCQFSCL